MSDNIGAVGNEEMPEFRELTLSEITMQVNELRGSITNLQSQFSPFKHRKTDINKQQDILIDNYRKTLSDLQAQRDAIDRAIAELDSLVNSKQLQIEHLLKLQAEILARQEERDKIEASIKALTEIFEQNPKWNNEVALFQKEDVTAAITAYREGKNGFAIFNEMGLGKTLEAFFILQAITVEFQKEFGRKPRTLWLTKRSIVYDTIKEGQKWVPEYLALPLMGSETPRQRDSMFTLINEIGATVVANYEVMNTMGLIRNTKFDFIVIDEVHKLKGGANPNGPTKVFKNAEALARGSRFILVLSGTPMVNRPEEMWSYLHIFDPERFPSLKEFEKAFQVWDKVKATVTISADRLLKDALRGRVVRRRKDEVGIQLPEKMWKRRDLTMLPKQQEVYDMMRFAFFVWLDSQKTKPLSATAIIAQLTRLRQISAYPAGIKTDVTEGDLDSPEDIKVIQVALEVQDSAKIDESMEILIDLHNEGEQAVVASTFNAPLFRLQELLTAEGITSAVIYSGQKDTDLARKFQQQEIDVILINSAMGEGLNLQKNPGVWPGGASNMIMLDRWWSPARNDQVSDRIHRLGAKDAVTIHDLHLEDSVDQFIQMKYEAKQASFDNILERDEIRPASEWREMLQGKV